ncbi:MAG: DUF1572 family protein [Flavobacteriales bacterium]|nr:DUF1572 family protein [Flavobacteriales bacterium]
MIESQHITHEFIEQSCLRIEESLARVQQCVGMLNEHQLWMRPNENSNSVGNLVLHLCGNIRQYAIAALGETADTRRRDEEFSARGGYTGKELNARLTETVQEALMVIRAASPENLIKFRRIQSFDLSGIGIIIHVTEHFSYHTGQITFHTKAILDTDTGYYSGFVLT